VPRAPSPLEGVTPPGMASRHLERRYPPLFATTDPCASPKPSLRLRLLALVDGSLPVVSSPGWERDLPDVISADLSLRAWTPTPAAPAVHSPVSSHRTSAFPALGPGRRLASIPRSDFKRGLILRGCSIRLPSGPQVCLPPRSPLPQFLLPWKLGSRGVSIRASHGSLPPRASDMLAVRTGQLTAGDFHPIRSAALSAAPLTASSSDWDEKAGPSPTCFIVYDEHPLSALKGAETVEPAMIKDSMLFVGLDLGDR